VYRIVLTDSRRIVGGSRLVIVDVVTLGSVLLPFSSLGSFTCTAAESTKNKSPAQYLLLRAVRPRSTSGPSSDTVVPVPSFGTCVQPRDSREPGGLRWLVGSRGLVKEGEELLGSAVS
jgi:hypothetical protein